MSSVNGAVNVFEVLASLHPVTDFSRHTLVKPKIYHGREKRQISTTKQENGQHINHLQITLEVDGENLILDLTLNKQLIPKGFFQKHQENGKNLVYRPTKEEVDHCHYNGKVRGKPNSWVAISTCNGLSGVIFDGEEMHYLEKDNTINDSSVETNHFIYKHSNLVEHNKTCGYAGGAKDPEHTHSTTDDTFLRDKRSTENHELIRGPYNANKESKYVELVLVVDNRKYKELGEDKSRAIDQCKKIANIINGLYAPLNIFIALVGVVIWSEHDEMTFSPNGDSTLKSFLHYRKEKLIPEHPNDNAQLLTKFRFNGGVVGRALKGPICTYEYSGGINTDHSPVVGLVATTIAHMMGHNFGLEHDTTECKCPDEHCIMTLSSPTVATAHWSSCSLDYLRLAFTHGMDYCLKNKPESLFDSPVCGNGFVEPGEQCDCGLPEHCDNTCCNASTCMLYSNASCATGECCDLTTCKPKNAGTLCRSADHECDLPEYCTGQSEYCPNDVYKLDTEVCDEGKAFCYHGSCRTRSDQCKLLWGKTGNSSDNQCYELNIKGNRHGNCGYNKPNQTYSKCDQEDVLCGMLHCTHENERLEFGMESVAILSNSFINKKGSIISCKTAIVDLGTDQIDPGLTPDGAKCGEGKMCVNQKCRDVMSLRKQSPTCEKDCNGKGWCNNKGHCHCMDGYAPPFCESPGPGGSEDSGPASDPNASIHPVTDFSLHTLVKPKIYHGREKRQISTTKQENGEHVNHLQITLEVDGENLILDLTLNKQLIPKGFFQKHQENGKNIVYKPTKEEVDHCHYNGKVRGKPNSWVAVSTCNGLSGVIFDGEEMHYLEKDNTLNDSSVETNHFIYKHSNLVEHNKTCGYAGGAKHTHSTTDNRFLRYKRSTENHELIRGPYNANKESKYVELVLVVDNREYKELGESKSRVVDHCKKIANIINGLYAPLNIFIALVGVVIWSEHDEMTFSPNGDSTLTSFLHYRKEKLIPEHPNDNAQLLTKFNFDHGVVGKALKGPMCTYEYSGGVNTDHSPVVGLVATTIAHEMGHNFGMEHDTTECKCPDERCIMAPSSSTVAPTHWSSCSLNYLLLAFTHGMDYCLKNKPESLFDSPVCGNGFVEPGEQCDCGLPEHCDNTCCNASTCMLYSNASCATGECCDLMTCKPKNAGTLCRSADYECDLPEYCTGQSEYCPDDIYKLDTEVCDEGKSFCYHGFCRTRTDQCKLLWGETGKSSDDQCYEMNTKGSRHGNCGYNKFNQSYFKCDQESVLCGMLHCKHLNERLEFGMESVAILSHSFINKKGSIIPCRTAIVDLGTNQIDPGLTPDGAKCGEGKMCVNQKCRDVMSLRKQSPTCEKDCNGKGWCNNKGHCHCMDGFAPPFCEYPGPGGSEDSGPASDPNARQGVVVAMFIIFLGVIPTLALIAFLMYYAKYNMKFGWKKSPSTTAKSPNKSRGPPFPNEVTKRTEDNHSLLHEDSPPPNGIKNEFFGNFRGFSLTPMKKEEPEPVRPAPPPPVPATIGWNLNNSNANENYQKPPPPVPTVTLKAPKSSLFSKPVQKMNSFRNSTLVNGIKNSNNTATVPALPPPNPGSTARPIISSPVLESSTSSAKELISPLRNAPKVPFRPAPEAPKTDVARPLSNPEVPVVHTVLDVNIEPAKKNQKDKEKENIGTSALNRITSFLKPSEKKPVVHSNSLPKTNQVKAQKILDKKTLRNLEISGPLPQTQIDLAVTAVPVDTAKKTVVMRAQSMRTKPKERPNIQTFGSMRQPAGYKRPLSIPSANRPKSPPPPAPPLDDKKVKSSDKLNENQNQYDDCLNEAAPLARLSEENSPTSGDNIYAVIDETLSPEKVKSSAGSSESMGLLGEIVSEIQHRNFDSIYSTSTLSRKRKEEEAKKKKEAEALSPESSEYANSSMYKSENEYSNMGNLKSSASSTSSGYILPSAVNVPVKGPSVSSVHKPLDKEATSTLSSFKSDASTKPFASTFKRPAGPLASGNSSKRLSDSISDTKNIDIKAANAANSDNRTTKSKNPISPVSKTAPSSFNKTPPKNTINRQVTPPNLRSRKPSPTRSSSQASTKSNRSVTNSPDLVTSCNTNSGSKGPDVLNGGTSLTKKPSISSNKPTINTQKPTVKTSNINSKSVSGKSLLDKKSVSDVKPPLASKVTKANSDLGTSKTASTGVKNAARSNSNVASLQQKFEEKNNAKITPKGKA